MNYPRAFAPGTHGSVGLSWDIPLLGLYTPPGKLWSEPEMRQGKKEDTTMTTTTIPTTTTQPPRHPKVKSFINHIITSTKITDELYENYYWVNPYELIFAA